MPEHLALRGWYVPSKNGAAVIAFPGRKGSQKPDAAVAFLRRRPDVEDARIGGIGRSVGGEMMLEAAARSRGLRAVVSEGAGERSVRDFLDMTIGGADKWLGLPGYAALSSGISLFSNQVPPPSLKDLVGRIAPTPVFFIYGEHGQDGERNLNPTYFAAAHRPKSISGRSLAAAMSAASTPTRSSTSDGSSASSTEPCSA